MKNIGCFLAFLCFALVIPAYADTDLTLFGAAQHQGKLTVRTATNAAFQTPSTFNPGTFGVFGMRVGHGRVFGGEHTIGYSPRFLEGDTKAVIYNSNILVQAPLPKVKPYGTAGMGFILSWGTNENGLPSFAKIGNKFALNYGGGVKVLPAGPVGIRFDLRGHLIPGAKFNVPTLTNPLTTVLSQSETLNIFEAGVGLIFSFKSRQ